MSIIKTYTSKILKCRKSGSRACFEREPLVCKLLILLRRMVPRPGNHTGSRFWEPLGTVNILAGIIKGKTVPASGNRSELPVPSFPMYVIHGELRGSRPEPTTNFKSILTRCVRKSAISSVNDRVDTPSLTMQRGGGEITTARRRYIYQGLLYLLPTHRVRFFDQTRVMISRT